MQLSFTKMQGLGNDYIYIDAREHIPADLPALARRLSDRHFGIGSDGIVLITNSPACDFGMRIFNADGSEAQMCGNASRCIAKYVFERGLTTKTTLTLQTLAGVKTLSLQVAEGRVEQVSVDMGMPKFIGITTVKIDKYRFNLGKIDMGNPHAVGFVSDPQELSLAATYGAQIENHPAFAPERTNVEFVYAHDKCELDMRVWERGSGETLACGTGACAAVVAAIHTQRIVDHAVVHLPGGDLYIALQPDGHIRMTGGAEFVFDGVIDL